VKKPTPLIILLGGGGHAAVVADAVRALRWKLAGYLDDAEPGASGAGPLGLSHLGAVADLKDVAQRLGPGAAVHAAVGDAALRARWLEAAVEMSMPAIVHPSAVISPSAVLEQAVFVGPRAIINARATVGMGTIINSGAIIEHDCAIGAFCHIAPGAVLAGGATVGRGSLIGAGAVVLPRLAIAPAVTLGAGSVATENLPEGATAAGNPARIVRAAPVT
jgi:acetyltransferase EpsM